MGKASAGKDEKCFVIKIHESFSSNADEFVKRRVQDEINQEEKVDFTLIEMNSRKI